MCGQCANEADHFMKYASIPNNSNNFVLQCQPVTRRKGKRGGKKKLSDATEFTALPKREIRELKANFDCDLMSYLRDVEESDDAIPVFIFNIHSDKTWTKNLFDQWNSLKNNNYGKYFILSLYKVIFSDGFWEDFEQFMLFSFYDILPEERTKKLPDLIQQLNQAPRIHLYFFFDEIETLDMISQKLNNSFSALFLSKTIYCHRSKSLINEDEDEEEEEEDDDDNDADDSNANTIKENDIQNQLPPFWYLRAIASYLSAIINPLPKSEEETTEEHLLQPCYQQENDEDQQKMMNHYTFEVDGFESNISSLLHYLSS